MGLKPQKWPGGPPMEALWSKWIAHLEPVFGGIPRMWSFGAGFRALHMCAGAGARGDAIFLSFPPFHPDKDEWR